MLWLLPPSNDVVELVVDVFDEGNVVLDDGDSVDVGEMRRDMGEDVGEVLDVGDDVEAVELSTEV